MNIEIDPTLLSGVDIGGSKIQVADTLSPTIHHYKTSEFPNVEAFLEKYFNDIKARPTRIVMAIAGPRDDETGAVQSTNFDWPAIEPLKLNALYPGTVFVTSHDLTAAAAGALQAPGIDLLELKPGTAKCNGPIIAVTIGTGLGVCAAFWDERSKRRIFFSGEAGHMGFMPYTQAEHRHLEHLFKKYDHPSAELAINGKHGVDSWLEHNPEIHQATKLKSALVRATNEERPTGIVLLEFATEGSGTDQRVAQTILQDMGALAGNILADYALIYRATGGIYLTGSVCHGLSEYWAKNTNFAKAFVRHGAPGHAQWLEATLSQIPIYLLVDTDIASKGALALAKDI